MDQAHIEDVRVAAAHEGVAELVVSLRHANGGLSEVALDRIAAQALLAACNTTQPEALRGASWQHVRDALTVSYNRFQNEAG